MLARVAHPASAVVPRAFSSEFTGRLNHATIRPARLILLVRLIILSGDLGSY